MTITKYEHACVVIEDSGKKLVIDPGQFSASFKSSSDIVAVVITHVHGDHLDTEKLQQIKADNPEVKMFGTQEVADEAKGLNVKVVTAGEGMSVAPFHLEFCGGEHATIHPSKPVAQNVGVVVNEEFYYPGDSFSPPCRDVKVLALPAGAPWMKVSESMDYLTATKAALNFPTHDAVLSEAGQQVNDSWYQIAAEAAGVRYQRLAIGEALDV